MIIALEDTISIRHAEKRLKATQIGSNQHNENTLRYIFFLG